MPRHSPYALIRLNFFCLVLSIFSWIAWVSWTFLFRFVNSCEKVLSFFVLNCFSTFRWNCILPKLERPIISTSDLVKFICPLICSFLTLQYSLFGFQWTYFLRFVRLDLISHRVGIFDLSATSPSFGRGNVPLVGSSGLEPPTSRLSGARSNHLSYEPIQFLSVYLVHSLTFFFCLPSVRTLSAPSPSCWCVRLPRYYPEFGCGDSPPGGDDGNRTHDPLLAGQVLSQLSYTPI